MLNFFIGFAFFEAGAFFGFFVAALLNAAHAWQEISIKFEEDDNGTELLSRDELAVLDGGKCILQLRGVRPFLSDKYDLTQHPNYKLTSDYDPKNIFDIEKYLNRKEKINPNDEFVVIDADSLPSA